MSMITHLSLSPFLHQVHWLRNKNLGGASVWTLDMDDFTGAFCADGSFPLVNHLRNSLGKFSSIKVKFNFFL